MTETSKSYKIPAERLASLQERIEKLNKKVARGTKRGLEGMKPISIEVSPMFSEPDPKGGPDRVYATVTLLSPEPPKANGWEFVGALTHVEGVGTVLRVVPGANVAEGELARYREASPDNCDHCNAKRRRLDTFILRKVG